MNSYGIVGFGTVFIVATIVAWFLVAPTTGSGWLIFIAYVGVAAVFADKEHSLIAVVAGASAVSASAAAGWYQGQADGLSDSGYLLGLAVITALVALAKISSSGSNKHK
ncbi:hypothetical protein KBI23_13890 [bacterium]|nr:hypothetical protein [bacterium]